LKRLGKLPLYGRDFPLHRENSLL